MCDYQCTSVSFIKLRIESNRIELFFPESECSTGHRGYCYAEFAVFTAWRYAYARSLLSTGVRLSVRPSVCLPVTLVYCIQTTKDIVKLLPRPSSPIILVFDSQRRYPIPRESLQRGRKIQGGGIFFTIFDWNRRISRKRYEIGPWLL